MAIATALVSNFQTCGELCGLDDVVQYMELDLSTSISACGAEPGCWIIFMDLSCAGFGPQINPVQLIWAEQLEG